MTIDHSQVLGHFIVTPSPSILAKYDHFLETYLTLISLNSLPQQPCNVCVQVDKVIDQEQLRPCVHYLKTYIPILRAYHVQHKNRVENAFHMVHTLPLFGHIYRRVLCVTFHDHETHRL